MSFDFHSFPMPLTQTDNETTVNEALSSASFEEVTDIPEAWWEMFGDPQLNQFIELALAVHPDIELASSRLRLAGEEAMLARSTLYPHFSFDAEIFRQKASELSTAGPPLLYSELGLDLVGRFDLDLWCKNRSLFYSWLDDMRAAYLDRQEAELLLASAIAQTYFSLQGNLARLEVLRQRVERKRLFYDLINQQAEHGIASYIPVLQAQQEWIAVENFVLSVELQAELDRHALAALVGNAAGVCNPNGQLELMPSAQFEKQVPVPTCLPLDLLARRPEISAQKWRIEAAGYRIRAAEASFYPNVNLVGFLGLRSIEFSKILQAQAFEGLGAAALHLPIFNAGELQAKLGIEQEKAEIAIDEYNQLVLRAVQEVADALSSIRIIDQQLQFISKGLEDAEMESHLADLRYSTGLESLFPVLVAQDMELSRRDDEIVALTQRLKNIVALIQAMGGGYYE